MCFLLAHNEEIVHKICSANACEILPVCMQVRELFIVPIFVLAFML